MVMRLYRPEADNTLNGQARSCDHTGTDFEYDWDTEDDLAAATLGFTVVYEQTEGA
jgi:hypothetical protein